MTDSTIALIEPKGHWQDGGKVWVEDHDCSQADGDAITAHMAQARFTAIRECIAVVDRPANASNSMEWKYDYVLPALRALLKEGSPAKEFVFTSDDDATEVLKSYGHEEHRNGIIKADWNTFDERCRAAINYLCGEWDFAFEHTDTPPEPDHYDTLRTEGEQTAQVVTHGMVEDFCRAFYTEFGTDEARDDRRYSKVAKALEAAIGGHHE